MRFSSTTQIRMKLSKWRCSSRFSPSQASWSTSCWSRLMCLPRCDIMTFSSLSRIRSSSTFSMCAYTTSISFAMWAWSSSALYGCRSRTSTLRACKKKKRWSWRHRSQYPQEIVNTHQPIMRLKKHVGWRAWIVLTVTAMRNKQQTIRRKAQTWLNHKQKETSFCRIWIRPLAQIQQVPPCMNNWGIPRSKTAREKAHTRSSWTTAKEQSRRLSHPSFACHSCSW